jgi:hypothetical protein
VPKVPFTDLGVQKLTPGTYWDAKLPAFGIRVGKTTRTWIVIPSQRRVRKVIGHYPNMPLMKARSTARSLLANRDTFAEVNFGEAAEQFMAVQKARTRPKSFYDLQRHMRRHLFPKLQHRALPDIKTVTVMGLIEGLLETPSQAIHVFVVARQFFRWAAARGYCRNIMEGQKPPAKSRRRTRVLSDDEIRNLWSATGLFADYAKLLLLTAQRRGELRKAQFRAESFTIPADVAKNGRAHVMPILPMAAKFVRRYPNFAWDREKRNLDKAMGASDWVLHDLRRTFRSRTGRLGIAPHIAERILNHISAQTELERVYDQYGYKDEMKEALAKWEEHIAGLIAVNEPGNGRHVPIETGARAA